MEIDLAKSVWFHVSLLYFLGVCFVVSSLSMVLGLSVFVSASMWVCECLLKCLCAGVCLSIVPFYVYVCILDWRVHVGMWPFIFEDMIVGRLASVTVYVTK